VVILYLLFFGLFGFDFVVQSGHHKACEPPASFCGTLGSWAIMVKSLFFMEVFVFYLRSECFSEDRMCELLMPCKNDMCVF
jgi:hypothetical protein